MNGRAATAADADGPAPDARPVGKPWTLPEAAQFLNISERHLASLVAAKRVRSILVGRRRQIADSELRYIAEHGARPAEAEGSEPARSDG